MVGDIPDFLEVGEPLPFEQLFVPIVLHARAEVRKQVEAEIHGLLSATALAGWERYLLIRLTDASAQAAHWQFQVFKTVRMAFPCERPGVQKTGDVCYRDFVGADPSDRRRKLFDEFPVLAKLSAVLVSNWIAALVEFLRRLAADRSGFNDHFPKARFGCPIANIEAGLGDPHRDGRCVVRVTFDDGVSLIYKPRSLAPEAHFAKLLEHFNTASTPHLFQAARCWDRGEYGWMEDIAHRPCDTKAGVHAFYWRAGVLLGLLHLARGVDCHQGNLIAAGEFPVFIDLEALWHPQTGDGDSSITDTHSILRTGFLPKGHLQPGSPYQWSGLSLEPDTKWPRKIWVRINEDGMALERHWQTSRNRSHLPVLASAKHPASEYASDIQAGFRWAGDDVLGDQKGREKFEDWLRMLASCQRRRIFRPTVLYQAVLQRLTRPDALRDDQAFTDQLEASGQKDGPEASRESYALSQLDIPYFEQVDFEEISPDAAEFRLPARSDYLAQIAVVTESLGSEH